MKIALTPRRLGVMAVALAAVAAGTSLPAQADTVPVLGTIVVDPAAGDGQQFLGMDTSGPCPDGTTAAIVRIVGQDIQEGDNVVSGQTSYSGLQTNGSGGSHVEATSTLRDVFIAMGTPPKTGDYTLVFTCQNTSGSKVFGEFRGDIAIVATGGFNLTYSQASQAKETTVALAASPAGVNATGRSTTLTATVSPAAAKGIVQFKREGASFGSAVTVVDGQASWSGVVPDGSSSLKAEFVPSDPHAFQGSTSSAVSYLVAARPVLLGKVAVGSKVSCSVSTGGDKTYAWTVDGQRLASPVTSSLAVPASAYRKKLGCSVVTQAQGSSVTTTSSTATVGVGAALRSTKAPKLTGTAKVGKKLTCSAGTWSPTASGYTYAWKRGSSTIKGAKRSSYKLVKADRRKSVSCVVTASKTGYAAGRKASAGKKVS